MKVTAFYYLDYPNASPIDRGYAATRMYVERGDENDSTDHFQDTYSFRVYTMRYVEEEFFNRQRPLAGRAILIVPELDDAWMLDFLNANIEELDEWGEKQGL